MFVFLVSFLVIILLVRPTAGPTSLAEIVAAAAGMDTKVTADEAALAVKS